MNLNVLLLVVAVLYLRYSETKECLSILVRRDIESLNQLENCTVVKGSVIIAYIRFDENRVNFTHGDFSRFKFPKLREITEFLFITTVNGLESLSEMFPNLSVIRGINVNVRFSLSIFDVPDIKNIGLKSLTTIQRGYVYIDSSPKLCYIDTISWANITHGDNTLNYINPMNKSECGKCSSQCENCWSENQCQHYENDNLIETNNHTCHTECLGGCTGPSATECYVCKNLTEGNKCVNECSPNSFISLDHMRCYSENQCRKHFKLVVKDGHRFECVSRCPPGFKNKVKHSNGDWIATYHCKKCSIDSSESCDSICDFNDEVKYLEHIQFLRHCTVINGSLSIHLSQYVSIEELVYNLGDITTITNFFKVHFSAHLTTLSFMKNLRIIKGEELESEYSLLIYNNMNLTKLWNWDGKNNITLENGGIYLHSNNKLCNHEIRELEKNVKVLYDELNHITYNDDEVLCGRKLLNTTLKNVTHNSAAISWEDEKTFENIELLYRELGDEDILTNHTDVDADICLRHPWHRITLPESGTTTDTGFISYGIKNLKQNTKYVAVIKTFSDYMDDDYDESISQLHYFKTDSDLALPPIISTNLTEYNIISLNLKKQSNSQISVKEALQKESQVIPNNQDIKNYLVEIYDDPDDQKVLNTRDYFQSFSITHSLGPADIDTDRPDCSDQIMEQKEEDDIFYSSMAERFHCTVEKKEYCEGLTVMTNWRDHFLHPKIHFYTNNTARHVISKNLHHFTRYIFKIYSCNDKGCGSFAFYKEKTALKNSEVDNNYSDSSPNQVHNILTVQGEKENQYYIKFQPPKNPNGAVLEYIIEIRNRKDTSDFRAYKINPREYEEKYKIRGFEISAKSTDEFRIRVISLGTMAFGEWISIESSSNRHLTGKLLVSIFFSLIFGIGIMCWIKRNKIRDWYQSRRGSWRPNIRAHSAPELASYSIRGENELVAFIQQEQVADNDDESPTFRGPSRRVPLSQNRLYENIELHRLPQIPPPNLPVEIENRNVPLSTFRPDPNIRFRIEPSPGQSEPLDRSQSQTREFKDKSATMPTRCSSVPPKRPSTPIPE